ncbi:hypothetical protein [Bacillus mycoides]|uniref:hypothetical protein n=1 Tax=Bacillus mycoides TaxID=1405 RepID=UPI003D241B17
MSHTRNNSWAKKLRDLRNPEALPPVIIRSIWTRYDRGQTSQKIYEKLKEERQISASFETVEAYIEKVVKPYYEKKMEN